MDIRFTVLSSSNHNLAKENKNQQKKTPDQLQNVILHLESSHHAEICRKLTSPYLLNLKLHICLQEALNGLYYSKIHPGLLDFRLDLLIAPALVLIGGTCIRHWPSDALLKGKKHGEDASSSSHFNWRWDGDHREQPIDLMPQNSNTPREQRL